MERERLEEEVRLAEAEILRIDGVIARLERWRAVLRNFVGGAETLLDELSLGELSFAEGLADGDAPSFRAATGLPSARPASMHGDAVPPPVTRQASFASDGDARRARSRRRRYMADVVDEAIGIILGDPDPHPMTAAEIHARHGRRGELTSKELYVALYKRVEQGRHLRSVKGKFWPLDRPLPDGWSEAGPIGETGD